MVGRVFREAVFSTLLWEDKAVYNDNTDSQYHIFWPLFQKKGQFFSNSDSFKFVISSEPRHGLSVSIVDLLTIPFL